MSTTFCCVVLGMTSTHCRHSGISTSGWSPSHTGWSLSVLAVTELGHWKGGMWPSRSARGHRREQGGRRAGERWRSSRRIVTTREGRWEKKSKRAQSVKKGCAGHLFQIFVHTIGQWVAWHVKPSKTGCASPTDHAPGTVHIHGY